METGVDEKVSVWAFFDPSTRSGDSGQVDIFPIAMNWNRRFVKFEKVILRTAKRVGDVRLIDFVCAGEGANYQIEYNTSDYQWRVMKVMEI